MEINAVKNISVIGAGNMGHQIAALCALKGYCVSCTDISGPMLEKASVFFKKYIQKQIDKGKTTQADGNAALKRLTFTSDLGEAVKNADYVIEAAIEQLKIKQKLFKDIDGLAPAHAILATNSSFIVSSSLAHVTGRPDKVLNLHFFNPALVMKLVEVVQGPHVSDETARISMGLCEKLSKVPVLLKKEVKGFLLNRIFKKIYDESLWMLEMGVASAEDIDKACEFGAGHPMGPFKLMDLTGIDLAYTSYMENFKESGDLRDLPVPRLVEKYTKGEFGQKAGKGWYEYSS